MEKVFIVDSALGFLALNQDNAIVDKVLFPKSPEKAAEKVLRVEAGEVIEEVEEIVKRFTSRKDVKLVLENSNLAKNIHEKFKIDVEVEKPSKAGEYLRANLPEVAVQTGFSGSKDEFYSFLHEFSIALTKAKVRREVMRRDKIVIQLINAVDELDKTLNLYAGRIGEWYGLHFPELSKIVDAHETYVKLIRNVGLRENFNAEKLAKLEMPKSKVEKIVETAKSSIGAPMSIKDVEVLQRFCDLYLETLAIRQLLTEKIDEIMGEIAPNIKALAGPTLGARLIALSGGLEELAKLPASTIQVLGAEKALFRALRTGAKPPKHGVIFQHYLIRQAPKWQRGKIARALAGKLAIAARVDAFTCIDQGEKFKSELEKRVEEIREKYKAPPPKPSKGKKIKKKKG
ncbi:MAG: C/D box methylation guide ribonucleoprotein complex aNOP56 subunit [Candidatus Bathyarchaeota archaeon]